MSNKIFITGHLGYLGSEFIKKYGKDFEIIGYDIKEGNDLLDYENLVAKMAGCEQVLHLAAIPKPVEGKSFEEYFDNNVRSTANVLKAAIENKIKRVIYASSTTIYGIERGIPFEKPINEDQKFISQYLKAEDLKCRDVDLAYHVSKVMAEQVLAWHGLMKKVQTIALRFGPIGKVFLDTSVGVDNATQAINLCLNSQKEFWYEAFSIVDEVPNIDITKAKDVLGYKPEVYNYTAQQIH